MLIVTNIGKKGKVKASKTAKLEYDTNSSKPDPINYATILMILMSPQVKKPQKLSNFWGSPPYYGNLLVFLFK
ncbi:hypothetical protein [Lactobacillus sp. ESL0262]|uniref:hypothetical protein n=1 Tax=Lactobacillus sp. ESL0262 TaxID=2069349 RepID=UPI000D6F0BC5|nr:hypothetical protein [Lactobacillus sp. ESL0262]AWN34163.1 hypothetical protein DLD54_08260 [Lactobacillus helsingborgensis]RMC52564.1 hypothetical protein F5ESL0262_08195 [Lactobacillus sp. ESL0262]